MGKGQLYLGSNHFAPMPAALYGVVMLMAAIAYYSLQQAIIATSVPGQRRAVAKTTGNFCRTSDRVLLPT
jgi:uncharacterized membrane protein